MTTKERVLRAMEALPDDATIEDAIDQLRRLARGDEQVGSPEGVDETAAGSTTGTAHGDVWNLLGNLAGKFTAPADWASEHDHYLYGSPKRSSAA